MSTMHNAPFTVALAQVVPVFLDPTATLEKACELMVDAGHAGACLIVFPAAFIPGYPEWIWSIPPTGKPVTVTGIALDRIVGGKFVEGWLNFDALGLLQQLGVGLSMG